jgi:hypothetical protein
MAARPLRVASSHGPGIPRSPAPARTPPARPSPSPRAARPPRLGAPSLRDAPARPLPRPWRGPASPAMARLARPPAPAVARPSLGSPGALAPASPGASPSPASTPASSPGTVPCARARPRPRPLPGAVRPRPWHATPARALPPRPARSRPDVVVAPSLGAAVACSPLRGLELGQRAARAFGPGVAPLPARGACAARPRRARGSFAACQRGLARACSRGARSALVRLAVPSTRSSTPRRARLPLATRLPPLVYFMRVDHVIYINKWKLNSEIDYVSYFT